MPDGAGICACSGGGCGRGTCMPGGPCSRGDTFSQESTRDGELGLPEPSMEIPECLPVRPLSGAVA